MPRKNRKPQTQSYLTFPQKVARSWDVYQEKSEPTHRLVLGLQSPYQRRWSCPNYNFTSVMWTGEERNRDMEILNFKPERKKYNKLVMDL